MENQEKCKWCENPAVRKKRIPNIEEQFDQHYDVCEDSVCEQKLTWLYKSDRNMLLFQLISACGILPLLPIGFSLLFNLIWLSLRGTGRSNYDILYYLDILGSNIILILLVLIFYPINILGNYFLGIMIKAKQSRKELFGFFFLSGLSSVQLIFSWNGEPIEKITILGYDCEFPWSHCMLYTSIAMYIYFSKIFSKKDGLANYFKSI